MNALTEPRQTNNATLINQSSGDTEIYSPPFVIAAAREVMGRIDLDPASSKLANENIGATRWFGKEHNGLTKSWHGKVWMNHPFSAGWKACTETCNRKTCQKRGFHIYEDIPSNADWINKLVTEYESGPVYEACCISFASTSEAWFQPLLKRLQCFLSPRTNYYLPDGSLYSGVTKGSAITYFGRNPNKFRSVFEKYGVVK